MKRSKLELNLNILETTPPGTPLSLVLFHQFLFLMFVSALLISRLRIPLSRVSTSSCKCVYVCMYMFTVVCSQSLVSLPPVDAG